MKDLIIDVREKDEFASEHVENSINIPLTQFAHLAPGIMGQFTDRSIKLMCVSGKRAGLAQEQVKRFGISFNNKVEVYSGGIQCWKKEGHPVVKMKKGHLPILRQTHLAAGALALLGTLLGVLVNPYFFIIPGFVGAGLTLAGATGFCGMSLVLAEMPWNKNTPELEKEVCLASTGEANCDQR
ncbi:rhodanese-like domain-containing protein [Bacteriovoracaceae bacterium]|nr:rhodanese-like domain-containing protein [Bacteriovoracaceae bacterium]